MRLSKETHKETTGNDRKIEVTAKRKVVRFKCKCTQKTQITLIHLVASRPSGCRSFQQWSVRITLLSIRLLPKRRYQNLEFAAGRRRESQDCWV